MPGPGRHRHPNGSANQDMSLEQALRYVKAKDAGKRSASRSPMVQRRQARIRPRARSRAGLSHPGMSHAPTVGRGAMGRMLPPEPGE